MAQYLATAISAVVAGALPTQDMALRIAVGGLAASIVGICLDKLGVVLGAWWRSYSGYGAIWLSVKQTEDRATFDALCRLIFGQVERFSAKYRYTGGSAEMIASPGRMRVKWKEHELFLEIKDEAVAADRQTTAGTSPLPCSQLIYVWSNHLTTKQLSDVVFNIRRENFTGKFGVSYTIYTPLEGDAFEWIPRRCQTSRMLETMVFSKQTQEQVIEPVERFLHDGPLYRAQNRPWRTTLLLHGPPGTGKTSIVPALAAHHALPVFMLSGNATTGCSYGRGESNYYLRLPGIFSAAALVAENKPHIVVIDDVVAPISPVHVGQIAESEWVLGLDGIIETPGRIVIITTNSPEQFVRDRLSRPGRVDHSVEFGPCDREQLLRLVQKFTNIGGIEDGDLPANWNAPTPAQLIGAFSRVVKPDLEYVRAYLQGLAKEEEKVEAPALALPVIVQDKTNYENISLFELTNRLIKIKAKTLAIRAVVAHRQVLTAH